MTYTTPDRIRELFLGVDATDAPDSQLYAYITMADNVLIEDITKEVTLEVPNGSVNGTNTEFSIENFPIADSNADKLVNGSDITVKGWKADGVYDTLSVASLTPERGIFWLTSAPSASTYPEGISVDYRYQEGTVDWTLVEQGAAQYATFLYLFKEHSLMPLKLKMGGRKGLEFSYGYTVPTYPYDKMREQYHFTLSKIRDKLHKLIQMDEGDLERDTGDVATR